MFIVQIPFNGYINQYVLMYMILNHKENVTFCVYVCICRQRDYITKEPFNLKMLMLYQRYHFQLFHDVIIHFCAPPKPHRQCY